MVYTKWLATTYSLSGQVIEAQKTVGQNGGRLS
jgi:hypothetical protein